MTASIAIHPPTSPTSAPDRRLRLTEEQYRQFARSAYTGGLIHSTEVETQAFIPEGDQSAIVMLVTRVSESESNVNGSAEVMVSPEEARRIGQMLIVSASEAEDLTRQAREIATGMTFTSIKS